MLCTWSGNLSHNLHVMGHTGRRQILRQVRRLGDSVSAVEMPTVTFECRGYVQRRGGVVVVGVVPHWVAAVVNLATCRCHGTASNTATPDPAHTTVLLPMPRATTTYRALHDVVLVVAAVVVVVVVVQRW
jgi:hypothetical protein